MKNLITALMLLCATSTFATTLELPIVKVIDGDTISSRIDSLPCPLCRVSIRIRHIDTPEKAPRAKCPKEAELAKQASAITTNLAKQASTMTIRNAEWDKYGGRILGDVYINSVNVGEQLIVRQLAYPYQGGKKQSWCR